MGFFFYSFLYNVSEMKNTTPIDLVIPWVDNQDQVWRNTYINFCSRNRINQKVADLFGDRYGGIRYIDYQLKLVSKNMPWINKIYLLLSNIEQAPKNLPSNCVIVLHKEFIPFQHLPTFNSTTIEMFLWNIPNLSEKFIYANDDMLPIGALKPSDFFRGDKIKIGWRERDFVINCNVYGYQCHNNCVALSKELNYNYPRDKILLPQHSFTPMIKSHCKECFNLIKNYVVPHIRAFRTEKQYNQYIYPIYEHWKYGTLESKVDFLYTELDKEFDLNHQIICVNRETKRDYVNQFLKGIKELCE